LSRRDRKARHLAAAGWLRRAFPEDGEEAADVIAAHYLDALRAVPEDPDAGAICGQAIGMLVHAGQRAERTGAFASAAASYAAAAGLSADETGPDAGNPDRPAGEWRSAGSLWEMAAEAAHTGGDHVLAVEHAVRAQEDHLRHGRTRAAARSQSIAGH